MYDIFISYRRNGGEALACLLSEKLKRLGYKVFYDVESLRNGFFNEKIYDVIESCEDVIVVLPEHGLDRCKDKEDWVRKEIEKSITMGKNIIPVLMRNFKFPDDLPEGMKKLPFYNGVTASMEYFDATFDRLLSMLTIATKRNFINASYVLLYNSFSQNSKKRRIICNLDVDASAHAVLKANVNADNNNVAEYLYYGEAVETDNNIYVRLDNSESSEKIDIVLVKAAGKMKRYIGIMSALSPSMSPVSFKCVCVQKEDIEKINDNVLEIVLEHSNKEWNNNILAIESYQSNLFYSDSIFQDK